ncbi:MAG: TonB-dependent receptor, partial [Bacteroidetes bacterium]|nr:TonB-dependent receptor [Bacteroidota bacterium]
SVESQAQTTKGTVQGTVIDGSTKIIESATITLLRTKDSTVFKMGVADKMGKFSFESIPDGRYLVAISAVGHQKGYSESFEISSSNSSINLKTIELVQLEKSLSAVTIVAKKPLVEQKIDRTIVNVEAAVTNVGNSALEVLEKSPGVSVDKDGNISLKGKSGVQVYIDGRPAYLSGADLANMLRSMSASQLEQIEIMTNPPAKYDAAGNSGVINIKTKKNKQFGYNGSLTTGYTQAIYARFNEGLNFNYRNNKVNLFSNLSYNHNDRKQILYVDRNFRDVNTKNILSEFDQESVMKNSSDYYSAKIGLDYFASKKTTFGIVFNGYTNPGLWRSNTNTLIYDPNGNLVNQTKAYSENDQKWKNLSANLNFRTLLDSSGREISGDFDYIQYRSTAFQPLISWYYDNNHNLLKTPDTLMGRLPQDITIYSGKVDYTHPLKKGAKLEAGIKSSYVKTDNNAIYDSIQNGQVVHDFNRSNHFIYEENINAAYVNYTQPLGKKWTGQFGLRFENTNAKGNQLTTNQKFTRNFSQLFPTVYLQYAANEKNQFVINYGRRINRPDYEDLNPFIHFLDRYTFEQGNPDLVPQFSHNIELTHTYNGFLSTTLNFSTTKNIIQQVFEQNENTNETFIRKANIASMDQFGISVSAHNQITKWWSSNIYVNAYNNRFKGIVNNDYISIGVTGMLTQIQQQFKWGKGWGAELSGFYRSKGLEGVIYVNDFTQINAGFSKQVLKNKGTVRLSVNDIFKSMNVSGYSKYSDVDIKFRNIQDAQSVSLSFTWRFNKGKLKANAGRREGSASDEKNRVKGSGN